jgi:hypothetical protein
VLALLLLVPAILAMLIAIPGGRRDDKRTRQKAIKEKEQADETKRPD